jgi:hypothetical protein
MVSLDTVSRLSLRTLTKKPSSLQEKGFVPEAGIEPALLAEHEFESCASTSSATQA